MKLIKYIIVITTLFTFLLSSTNIEQSHINDTQNINNENENIKQLLKTYLKSKELKTFINKSYTNKYYKYYDYELFWISDRKLRKTAFDLIKAIKNDAVLKPFINKLFDLNSLTPYLDLQRELTSQELIEIDVLLTGIYHKYMKYLSKGVINWHKFQKKLEKINKKNKIFVAWRKYEVRKNIRKLLYKASDKDDIFIAINSVNYTFHHSKQLEKKLEELEKIASNGGLVKIPKPKKPLREGRQYPEIIDLRKRLMQSKDLNESICDETYSYEDNTDCTTYDKKLYQAVKLFQKRNGLKVDGVVGKETIRRLNEPINDKIKKVRINLERMRWMPRTLGKKHIVVNIPEFKLKLFSREKIDLEMPIIVGQKKHPTPIFSNRLSQIVLNPYWRIPQGIVKKEIIPKLLEDKEYLEKEQINVYENWDHESMQYDVSNVDWSFYSNNDLIGTNEEAPMRFIQTPGDKNPLGRIKFLFPNIYSVYMHDTPLKYLFQNDVRAFSHGCIRLSKPKKLLKKIAKYETTIDYKKTVEVLKENSREEIELNKTIPIHIVYITSWVDEDGRLNFRDDIYNYDKIQEDILFSPTL